VLFFFFGGYILFDSLCLRDKKKSSQPKKKRPFCFEIFLPIAGEKRRGEEQRKSNTLTRQTVIYLMRVLPGRKSIAFYKQGKDTPLL